MITTKTFWRIIISGFIATYVMMMTAFLQGGVGLPVIDVGHILKTSFNFVHGTETYSIVWGNAAYFIMGLILALIWVVFLQKRTPGNWLIQGILYGVAISIMAGLIIAPLAARATGDTFGIFYMDTWAPFIILLGGLVMHLSYGIVLTLCLKVAGVYGPDDIV